MQKHEKNEITSEIKKLYREEMKQTTALTRKIEICDEKKAFYEDLNKSQNRDMGLFIFCGIMALVLFMLIQPFKILLTGGWITLGLIVLQGLFWYTVYNFIHLVVMFYDAQYRY